MSAKGQNPIGPLLALERMMPRAMEIGYETESLLVSLNLWSARLKSLASQRVLGHPEGARRNLAQAAVWLIPNEGQTRSKARPHRRN
jgi:hypothetical protein